jgi:hypothetical protein
LNGFLPIAPELGPGPITCGSQPASNLQKHVFGIRVLPLSSVGAAGGLPTTCTLSLSMPYNWPDVPTCHHTAGLQPIESEHGLVDRYCTSSLLAYREMKAFDQGPPCGSAPQSVTGQPISASSCSVPLSTPTPSERSLPCTSYLGVNLESFRELLIGL